MPGLQNGLPPPSADLVICRVAIEAFIEVSGRKKSERFLQIMAEALADEERMSEVLRLRGPPCDSSVRAARREAMAWFRTMLPVFMARLQ